MLYPEASIFSGGWLRLRIRLKVDRISGAWRKESRRFFFNLLWFPRSQGSEKIQIYQTGKFKSREAKWFAWGHLPKMLLSEQKCMSIHTSSTHSFSRRLLALVLPNLFTLWKWGKILLSKFLRFWHKQWNHPLVFAVVRQTPMQPLKNQFPALHWEHELGLAFTKNRMNYTNKFLVIPESGDYFVYSQVTFRGTISECGEISKGRQPNKPDSIIVVITKVTDSYPEPTQLLMGTKSVCEIGSNWFQPIYLGAMFSLNEGDKLMVNVSDISLVDYTKEDKTFFGAFLL